MSVRIRVLRRYPRGGTVHLPGDVVAVPESALPGILGARPPYGEPVEVPAPPEPSQPEPEPFAPEAASDFWWHRVAPEES